MKSQIDINLALRPLEISTVYIGFFVSNQLNCGPFLFVRSLSWFVFLFFFLSSWLHDVAIHCLLRWRLQPNCRWNTTNATMCFCYSLFRCKIGLCPKLNWETIASDNEGNLVAVALCAIAINIERNWNEE